MKKSRKYEPQASHSSKGQTLKKTNSWLKRHKDQIIINILGSLGAATLIGILFGFPRFVIENWSFVRGYTTFLTSDPLKVEIIRSLVNHELVLTKGPNRTVKDFKVVGQATTFQMRIRLVNTFDQPVSVSSLSLFGVTPSTQISTKPVDAVLNPFDPKVFVLPEIPLYGIKDSSVIPALLSGKLLLKIVTNFGSQSLNLDCVCFFGSIQPGNEYLYWAGSDSSCLKFELQDEHGLASETKGFTSF